MNTDEARILRQDKVNPEKPAVLQPILTKPSVDLRHYRSIHPWKFQPSTSNYMSEGQRMKTDEVMILREDKVNPENPHCTLTSFDQTQCEPSALS
jgi:hypothetical protein